MGLQTEDCGGIGSADRDPLGASGLQTEVPWGHRVCRLRYLGALGMETEVCGGIGSADRGRRGHRVCRQRSVAA